MNSSNLKDRLSDVVNRVDQELREKGANQAIRDDLAQLKDDVKDALANDKSHGVEEAPPASGSDRSAPSQGPSSSGPSSS